MKRVLVVIMLAVASGCATTGGEERDPRDPFEGFNRGVYKFNETFDDYLAKPVARAYVSVLHQEIRGRVGNFFANIQDIFIGANNVLQGKIEDGVNDWVRFAFNSTFGLLGIHDVASEWGFEKHNEDFGQTFGRWGVPPGPYLVLPFLSSSTLRDAGGTALDYTFAPLPEVRPIALRNTLYGLYFVNTRADLLEASRILEEAALDKYVFQRDAYLQRRRSLVYDGRPPREKLE
jgi:phospholipid-binding lipoprotein MlaA